MVNCKDGDGNGKAWYSLCRCLGFEDGLRQERHRAVSSSFRRRLDLENVFLVSLLGHEVDAFIEVFRLALHAPSSPTEELGQQVFVGRATAGSDDGIGKGHELFYHGQDK